jgi:hypothetical protein
MSGLNGIIDLIPVNGDGAINANVGVPVVPPLLLEFLRRHDRANLGLREHPGGAHLVHAAELAGPMGGSCISPVAEVDSAFGLIDNVVAAGATVQADAVDRLAVDLDVLSGPCDDRDLLLRGAC